MTLFRKQPPLGRQKCVPSIPKEILKKPSIHNLLPCLYECECEFRLFHELFSRWPIFALRIYTIFQSLHIKASQRADARRQKQTAQCFFQFRITFHYFLYFFHSFSSLSIRNRACIFAPFLFIFDNYSPTSSKCKPTATFLFFRSSHETNSNFFPLKKKRKINLVFFVFFSAKYCRVAIDVYILFRYCIL